MSLPPPQSGRTPVTLSSDARRAMLRRPHPLDVRDLFATDPDDEVRELGRLAVRRADVNDSFALGDLCTRLALGDGDKLRVFYVGKALIAYRRAGANAPNDVDRALAWRARERFIDWVVQIARATPTPRNLAVALWAVTDEDDEPPSSEESGESPRPLPTDLLYALLSLNGTPPPTSGSVVNDGATMTPQGEATEFAGLEEAVPLSEFEPSFEPKADATNTMAEDPTQMLGASASLLFKPGEDDDLLDADGKLRYPFGGSGEFRPGDRLLDRYEVAEVKMGGMGIVYLCYDHEGREPVALKSFQSRYLDNARAVARFEQEALTWINLNKHRHVVTAKRVQTIAGRPFILLEHVSGPEGLGADLRSWIEHHRITLIGSITFAIHIALGMQHVNGSSSRGLVHRDLKPANILVTQDGIAKVTDFGLVRSLDLEEDRTLSPEELAHTKPGDSDARLTRVGVQVGTIMYMSPEQWELRAVDLRADIYAYGIILYEMLTGRHPFASAAFRDRTDWQRAHLTQIAQFTTEENATLPAGLRALTLQCLAKDREDRPAAWGAILETLRLIYQDMTGELPPMEISGQELFVRDLMDKGYSLTELGRLDEAIAAYDRAITLKPDLSWAWARKGRTLRLLRRYDEALTCYDQALKLQPRYAWAWRGKGMVLEMSGDLAQALECYQKAATFDPIDIWNWYNQADMLGALNRIPEAIEALESALRIDPSHANSWAKLGQLQRQSRDLIGARKSFEEALRLNPRLAWAHNGYGQVLRAMGASQEALLAFKRAARHQPGEVVYWNNLTETLLDLDQHDEALKSAQQGVRIAPDDANAWAKLGQALRYLNRLDEALDAYERSVGLQSDFAWAINGMGIVMEQLGQFEDALNAYIRAAALSGHNASSLYNIGNALALLGRYDEALETLNAALAINPDYPRALARIGSIQRSRGNIPEALAAYQRATQVDVGYAWAWHEMGLAYEAAGDLQAALDAHQHASAASPEDPIYLSTQADVLIDLGESNAALTVLDQALKLDTRSTRLWTKYGSALRSMKRYTDALHAFNHAVECDPHYAWGWSGRGLTLMGLGRHEEALDSYRRALEIAPDEPLFLYNQGDALITLGHYRAATEVFERALRIDPDRPETWAKLGQALRRIDRLDAALEAYDRALALDVSYAWAWHGRGLTLESQDRSEEAAACYEKALAADDGVVWYHASLIDALLKMNHTDEALQASANAIARLPDQAVAWARRGQTLRHVKRYGEAVEAYDKSLELDARDGWTWNGRGLALRAMNHWDDALESFQQALAHDPGAIWYYHNCGEAWLMLDHPQKAIEVFEAGLQRDPSHEPTRRLLTQARERLKLSSE